MWELDHIEGWVLKNWCFWTEVLEKTLESPLDCKEIKPVHPKGDQPFRIFIWRNDAEAPILWPPDAKSYSDAGKEWRQEEKGMTKAEMVGWHHWLNRHESEQAPGDGEGRGSLVCCSPWGRKESDTTEQLNSSPLKAWLELEHPLPRWLTHKALGCRPQFPALWASPGAELYLHTCYQASSRSRNPEKEGAAVPFITWSPKACTVSSTFFHFLKNESRSPTHTQRRRIRLHLLKEVLDVRIHLPPLQTTEENGTDSFLGNKLSNQVHMQVSNLLFEEEE